MKYKLSHANSKYGAQMGRPNYIVDDSKLSRNSPRLHLIKLRWVCGDYDEGGAYWGNSGNDNIYCAWAENDIGDLLIEIFVRAADKLEAREKVAELIHKPKFFN